MAGWGFCRRCREPIWWGSSPYDSSRAFPYDDADEQQSHFESCAAQEWVSERLGDVQHRVSSCRACGARVWWQTTARGRRRPMDIDGEYATHECHFDSCPGERVSSSRGTAGCSHGAERGQRSKTNRPPRGMPYGVHLWLPDLELQWPTTGREITSAFRRLALKYHPDTGGPTADASAFIRCKLAYDRLKELLGAEVAT